MARDVLVWDVEDTRPANESWCECTVTRADPLTVRSDKWRGSQLCALHIQHNFKYDIIYVNHGIVFLEHPFAEQEITRGFQLEPIKRQPTMLTMSVP